MKISIKIKLLSSRCTRHMFDSQINADQSKYVIWHIQLYSPVHTIVSHCLTCKFSRILSFAFSIVDNLEFMPKFSLDIKSDVF